MHRTYIFEQFPKLTVPWLKLINSPTPISHLHILGNEVGHNNLWLKSDNLSGQLFGGNKVRNLEFLLAEARHRKASKLVTFGSIESNHALATAIYGKSLGFKVKVHLCNLSHSPWSTLTKSIAKLEEHDAEIKIHSITKCFALELLAKFSPSSFGFSQFAIPLGGANSIGCLGQMNAAFELHNQITNNIMPHPHKIFISVGSGGTIAGLIAGFALLNYPIHIVGICASKGPSRNAILNLANRTINKVTQNMKVVTTSDASVVTFDLINTYAGGGYGSFTTDSIAVIKQLEEFESIYLDKTYTGKAMSAFLDFATKNTKSEPILFWNTSNTRNI